MALAIQYGHMRTALGQWATEGYASRSRDGIHDLIDLETARATADTLAALHEDLQNGGGISGPAALRAIRAAATAPRFAGTFGRRRTLRASFIAGTCGGPASRVPAVPGGAPMAATSQSSSLVPVQPMFTDAERLALAGFLAGYRGLTREAYTLDLRQFTGWCRVRSVPLFSARRADIETFARELEAQGRARATVTRRLCTIAGFYKYAVEEEVLEHSPAAHVRRPRLDYESHATALDRNELGALLVTAGLGPAAEHALISLLALNGLRVSEATGADIEHLGLERGHRRWP